MKITGSAIKLGIVSLVLLLITVSIVVVFAQMRFNSTNSYHAEFRNATGLKNGQFVRAAGVEIGKVKDVRLIEGGQRVRVDFDVDRSIPLYQSTTAQIRYLNLFADRYLELKRGDGEGSDRVLPPGGSIPLSRTSPALDLDALSAAGPDAAVSTITKPLPRTANSAISMTRQAVAECLVADRRSDLPASERRARRAHEVLRQHRCRTPDEADHTRSLTVRIQAHQVASVLGDRSEQINRLLVNTKTLLAAFNERGHAIGTCVQNRFRRWPRWHGASSTTTRTSIPCWSSCGPSVTCWWRAKTTWLRPSRTSASSPHRSGNPSRRGRTSRSSCPTCCRIGSCSRSSTPPSRSAASTRKTSGAAPVFPSSAGPTPTAPGSPTGRRRPHLRCWKGPRIIRDRPSRRERRVRTHHRPTRCRGRGIRCPARA
ncbi:MCE family protein [Mycobacterium seoulense]|uniref:MCE family protein n=1 Tax=Mycobacterium seoulense TaxID=386911 RepID=UPI001E5ED116|nr:MlaD family protein [Mycobacterium seoulense]